MLYYKRGYIFFDYECMIANRRIPNLVIAKKICSKCVEVWKSNNKSVKCTSDCGIFNFNNNNSFCEWSNKKNT